MVHQVTFLPVVARGRAQGGVYGASAVSIASKVRFELAHEFVRVDPLTPPCSGAP